MIFSIIFSIGFSTRFSTYLYSMVGGGESSEEEFSSEDSYSCSEVYWLSWLVFDWERSSLIETSM